MLGSEPSWDTFAAVTGAAVNDRFEDTVCRNLFAGELGLRTEQIQLPKNLKGIEAVPVEHNSQQVSFQSKYSSNGDVPWSDFKESIRTACEAAGDGYFDGGLDRIICYTNARRPGAGTSRPSTQRQDEIDELAAGHGIDLDWRYGPDILAAVAGFPALHGFFVPDKSHLIYWRTLARRTSPSFLDVPPPFVGREGELDQLRAFLHDPAQFRWCELLGPSGSGKSRLLFQLAEEIDPKWSVVWLRPSKDAVELRPLDITGPTVLVIDGPLAFGTDSLGRLLAVMADTEPADRLRIVLVDRHDHSWRRPILAGDLSGAQDFEWTEGPMIIQTLTPAEQQEMIEALACSADVLPDEVAARVEKLSEDRVATPLEVIFAAFIGGGSLTESIRGYLDNKRATAYPHAAGDATAAATAVTVAGGFVPREAELGNLPPVLSQALTNKDLRAQLAAVLDAEEATLNDRCPAMSPDAVGELFVLDNWAADGLLTLPESLISALDLGPPSATAEFFSRATADFPSHPAHRLLLFEAPPAQERVWAVAQMAAAHQLFIVDPALGTQVHNRLARTEKLRDLTLLSLLLILGRTDDDSSPYELSKIDAATLVEATKSLSVRLPGAAFADTTNLILDPEYLHWFVESLDTTDPDRALRPVDDIAAHLGHDLIHSTKGGDAPRFERATTLLVHYAQGALKDGLSARESKAIEQATANGIASWSQFRTRTPAANYSDALKALHQLADDFVSDQQTALDLAMVMVQVYAGDEAADRLLSQLRDQYDELGTPATADALAGALVNHTAQIASPEHGESAANLVNWGLTELADDRTADTILQAAVNVLRKPDDLVGSDEQTALLRSAIAVVERYGSDEHGSTQLTSVLGERLGGALKDGNLDEARALVQELVQLRSTRFAEPVQWALYSTISAGLAREVIRLSDFAVIWSIFQPLIDALDSSSASGLASGYFGLLQGGVEDEEPVRNALRDLARVHDSAQPIAQALGLI